MCALLLLMATFSCRAATLVPSPFWEELTSTELRGRIESGSTTVLIPIGGTEQNGAHMTLGKHNVRAKLLAGKIAQGLGNAFVAPVVAYVPEGAVYPPQAHMRYAGTLSVPESVFEALLEATARSLKQHGVRDVVLLGDHGGYQQSLVRVAAKLNREWVRDPACRVLALTQYYRITQTDYVEALKQRGFSVTEIGQHAGLADTSLSLALDPQLVRSHLLASKDVKQPGVSGDPRRASPELGQIAVQSIVESSVQSIRAATQSQSR